MAYRRRAPDRRGTTLETLLARVLWIHASKDSDLSAPVELWPPARQLASSAIIGHVTLADVGGRPGAWRWMLASPHQPTEPVTGVQGHPGLWLIDLPPRLRPARPPGLIWQSHPS